MVKRLFPDREVVLDYTVDGVGGELMQYVPDEIPLSATEALEGIENVAD
jgi:hypothetical protein